MFLCDFPSNQVTIPITGKTVQEKVTDALSLIIYFKVTYIFVLFYLSMYKTHFET